MIMAVIDVFCTSVHRTNIRSRPASRPIPDLVPSCACGWIGPAYPENDYGSAELACRIHAANGNKHSTGTDGYHEVRLIHSTSLTERL